MLNKIEKILMSFIYEKCVGKKSMLFSPEELLELIREKYHFDERQLKVALNNISLEGYIELTITDNHGRTNYVISLTKRGEAFEREKRVKKINLTIGITRAVIFGIIAFLVSAILRGIFS